MPTGGLKYKQDEDSGWWAGEPVANDDKEWWFDAKPVTVVVEKDKQGNDQKGDDRRKGREEERAKQEKEPEEKAQQASASPLASPSPLPPLAAASSWLPLTLCSRADASLARGCQPD